MSNTATLAPNRPQSIAGTTPGRILLGIAATAIVALAAHVNLPLPFTPVPFILTPLAVLGVGLAFGPVGGFLVMLAYLAEGLAGLPVFSPTAGPGGILQLLGPTGGFLMSYPVVAFLAGGITRTLESRIGHFTAALVAGAVAVAVLFAAGAGWFHHAMPAATVHTAWTGAVLPFLPGEAVKVLAAAGLYSTFTRARRA